MDLEVGPGLQQATSQNESSVSLPYSTNPKPFRYQPFWNQPLTLTGLRNRSESALSAELPGAGAAPKASGSSCGASELPGRQSQAQAAGH